MKTSEPPVIVLQHFSQPLETVWKAITEVSQMRQWFFENIPNFKAEIGFQTAFDVQATTRVFTHQWTIKGVLPLQKIIYNWKYKDFTGDSFVTFELQEKEDGTLLTVTTAVIEDFPDDIPEFTRESCLQGWTYFIKERLVHYMEDSY
jgi:uncharacterized protein YndB with AHSA1/START domain